MKEKFFDTFQDFLSIFNGILLSSVLLIAFSYYLMKIDSTKIQEIRYCPSCGVDLLSRR